MLYTLRFFSSKCSLFHNVNLFGSCIIHILYTGCAEIKKKNSGAKGLISGRDRFLILRQSAREGGKFCQTDAPAAFTPQEILFLVLISVRG